jgi:uncharacterized membrane protein
MEAVMERGGDVAALLVFLIAWAAYEPILRMLARGRHVINADLVVIRQRWMGEMVGPNRQRLLDSQLIGHALNSASFFASSNLILIAGAAGLLFGSEDAFRAIEATPIMAEAPPILFSIKLGLIAATLARGFLSFIWSIRQLNYCVAVVGATPLSAPEATLKAYGEAAAEVLTPALSAFNQGVRAYYFALAAAAWLFGPIAMAAVTLGAVGLLIKRQAASPAAGGVRRVRAVLESYAKGPDTDLRGSDDAEV